MSPVQVQDIICTGPPPPLMDQESFEANSRDSSPQARDFVPNIVVESENIVLKAEDVFSMAHLILDLSLLWRK